MIQEILSWLSRTTTDALDHIVKNWPSSSVGWLEPPSLSDLTSSSTCTGSEEQEFLSPESAPMTSNIFTTSSQDNPTDGPVSMK